jgi:hypothetical protein
MEPDFGPRPDPGGDDSDDSSGIELLLETSSSDDGDKMSGFSDSEGDQDDWGSRNDDDGEPSHGSRDKDHHDSDDDEDSRPDPSSRGNAKSDPYMDGDSEFDIENPSRDVFVEDIIEDEFFPHLPEYSDGEEPVEIVEEIVDYPPDDERGSRDGVDGFDDEPSKGDKSEDTNKEKRIITFLSLAICVLVLLIAIAIGIGIGIGARNRNRAAAAELTESPTDFPTESPFPSQLTTFFPTVEDTVTPLPTMTASPTMTAEPSIALIPTTSPAPLASPPPVVPSTSPPPAPPVPTLEPYPPMPSTNVTDAPSSQESVESASPTFQETEVMQLLVNNSLDDGEALSSPGTPQNEAYQWLQTNAFLNVYTDNQILQRYALAVFFYSTNGPTTWDPVIRDDGWLTDAPECEWGSTANNQCTDGVYTSLTLDFVGVSGTIPDELSLLTSMQRFSVRTSEEALIAIGGEIPESMGRLTDIQTIRLNNQNLEGPIPQSVSLMTNLRVLVLSGNSLTGNIPAGLANTQGTTINLDGNELAGQIPTELFSLTDLGALNLQGNDLSGPIPTEIGNARSLSAINFAANRISGELPTELGALSEIRSSIDFSNNQLRGSLPSELGLLFRMSECVCLMWLFDVIVNFVEFLTPSRAGAQTGSFKVQNNLLEGTIPPALSGMQGIEEFRIDGNPMISGSMPAEVCQTFGNTTVSYSDCGQDNFECECCTFCCNGGLCECNIDDADLCAEALLPERVSS